MLFLEQLSMIISLKIKNWTHNDKVGFSYPAFIIYYIMSSPRVAGLMAHFFQDRVLPILILFYIPSF
jgi:hypothetical protein